MCRFSIASAMFVSFMVSPRAFAWQAAGSVGYFEPFDGVVNGLYDTNTPILAAMYAAGDAAAVSWTSHLFYNKFKSRVANLENHIQLLTLNSGFRKGFAVNESGSSWNFMPFFGAGFGATFLEAAPEDEANETSFERQRSYGFSSMSELGIQIRHTSLSGFGLDLRMANIDVSRKLFGNINIGGRVVSAGITWEK
jgi:hypothetical protein